MDEEYEEARERARARLAAALAAFGTGQPVEEVRGAARGSNAAGFARQVAMYICHVAFGMTLASIARAFRRDRSTVCHACQVVEDRRDDAAFDAWCSALEEAARAAPQPAVTLPERAA